MMGRPAPRPSNPLIVALDLSDPGELMKVAERLRGIVETVKVGLEAFTVSGPQVVRGLKGMGFRVFLDLKVHDIPRTAARAVEAAAGLGADMITLHCSGGLRMLQAAREACSRMLDAGSSPPLLLGVTVLTSMEEADLKEVGFEGDPQEQVLRLARLAVRAGLKGMVASARELRALRRELGGGPLLVVPGIRPAGSDRQDQARVGTPAEALRAGADYLVVGRPIVMADDPARCAREIIEELKGA